MLRSLFTSAVLCLLCACGGGGSQSLHIGGGGTVPAASGANVAAIVVDSGPATLSGAGISNVAYVTIKICVPNTSTCTTVDHVQVDTGSEGLRIVAGALDPNFVAALPAQADVSSNPVMECAQFLDGYVWGPVKTADFTVGGESVAAMPLQIIGASGSPSAPSACSNGLTGENTVASFGANGIIGIGPAPVDCGSYCAQAANLQTSPVGASYWICPGGNCTATEEDQSGAAPNLQLPNPVAKFTKDNNGSLIMLPSVAVNGQATASGWLIFGIGTEANNALGSAKVYTISSNYSSFTTVYNHTSFTDSYIDSGTSLLVFDDNSIPPCSQQSGLLGLYCPSSTLSLSATNLGLNSASGSVSFHVGDPATMSGNDAVLPALAGPSNTYGAIGNSFAWGLPFFYGRTVYTAIAGAATPGGTGPYFAY